MSLFFARGRSCIRATVPPFDGMLLKRRPVQINSRASFTRRHIPYAHRIPTRSLLMSTGLLTPIVVAFSGFGLYPWHRSKPPLDGRLREYARYDPNFTIITLLAINSVIFLLWKLGRRGANTDFGVPVTKRMMEAKNSVYMYPANVRTLNDKRSFWLGQFMRRHFMSSNTRTFSLNGWHTAITSMFSHNTWFHFLFNMGVLWLVGGGVHEIVGRDAFLGIFIGGGIFGTLCQVGLLRWAVPTALTTTLGMSGGLTALVAAMILHWPCICIDFLPDAINFVPDGFSFPSWVLLLLTMSADVFGLTRGLRVVAHGTHLGGYAIGAGSFMALGSTIGTTSNGRRMYVGVPYEGHLDFYHPTAPGGVLHMEHGDLRMDVRPNHTYRFQVPGKKENDSWAHF